MRTHTLLALVALMTPAVAWAENPFGTRQPETPAEPAPAEAAPASDEAAPAPPVASTVEPHWRSWEPNRHDIRLELGSRAVVTDEGTFEELNGDRTLEFFDATILGRVYEGLSVGARYNSGSAYGDLGALDDIDISLDAVEVLGRYTLDLIPWVAPYAELGGGLLVGDLDASSDSGSLGQTAYAPTVSGAIGVQGAYVARSVVIGVYTDHGYHFAGDLTYDEVELRAEASSAPPIDFGALDVRGYRWRFGVFLSIPFGR